MIIMVYGHKGITRFGNQVTNMSYLEEVSMNELVSRMTNTCTKAYIDFITRVGGRFTQELEGLRFKSSQEYQVVNPENSGERNTGRTT